MGIENILNIAASSMSAESIRLNVTASNIANAGTVAGTEGETYHAKHPIFAEVRTKVNGLLNSDQPNGGVRVIEVKENDKPLTWRFDPNNPLADPEGKIYLTDVNTIEEMVDMISASKQYQASVEVMNSAKTLAMQTIKAINNY